MSATSGTWTATGGRGRRRWGRLVALGVLAIVAAAAAAWATGWLERILPGTGPDAPVVVADSDEGEVTGLDGRAGPGVGSDRDGGPSDTGSGDADDTDPSGLSGREARASEGDSEGDERNSDAGGDGEPESEEPDAEPSDEASAEDEAEGADQSDEQEGPERDLAAVQSQLRELGYLLGPADGVKGPRTTAALMAFQSVNDLRVDGVLGPQTLGALEDPVAPTLRGGPATRIEVDLTRQVLHLVEDGERVVTLHVSSGSGEAYTTSSGGTAYGNTPVGEFVIERRIAGTREADLGTLYDPLYFHRGWAIHGSSSVPAYPASHGCVRLTRPDARWLFEQVPNGTPVHLYGGTHVFTPSR